MKRVIVFAGILWFWLVAISCNSPNPGTGPESSYIGSWVNTFGDTFVLSADTYEKYIVGFMSTDIVYAEKGSLAVETGEFTFTKEQEKPDGTGDWVGSDFDSKFERDRAEYNAYLAAMSLGPLDAAGYWDAHYTWAYDELHGGTSGSPYPGYVDGMTLDEYKAAARAVYDPTLTRNATWSLSGQYLTITDEGATRTYSKE
jgi:hypothetical protein